MRFSLERPQFIYLTIIVLLLILSLTFYIFRSPRLVNRILFFPQKVLLNQPQKSELTAEMRDLPLKDSLRENIRLFLEEIVLGPIKFSKARLLPGATRIKSVILNNSDLYIHYSNDILTLKDDLPYSVTERLKTIERNIYFNFRSIRDIHFFINGESIDIM